MATTGEKATGTITIEYNTVTVTPGADGDVWLTPSEIARMFEVFVPAITSNIRAIYKHGALRMSETSNLPTAHAELYNLGNDLGVGLSGGHAPERGVPGGRGRSAAPIPGWSC